MKLGYLIWVLCEKLGNRLVLRDQLEEGRGVEEWWELRLGLDLG